MVLKLDKMKFYDIVECVNVEWTLGQISFPVGDDYEMYLVGIFSGIGQW